MDNNEKIYTVKTKKGTHLVDSKKTSGAKRALLLDDETNELVGQAELIEVDKNTITVKKEDSNEFQLTEEQKEFLEFCVRMGVDIFVEKVIPLSKKLWKTKIKPNLKKRFSKKRNSRKGKEYYLEKLNTTHDKYSRNISSEEAQQELLEIFILYIELISRIDRLSNSKVDAGDESDLSFVFPNKEQIIDILTSDSFLNDINTILRTNSNLRESNKDKLISEIGDGVVVEEELVYIDNNSLKHFLSVSQ